MRFAASQLLSEAVKSLRRIAAYLKALSISLHSQAIFSSLRSLKQNMSSSCRLRKSGENDPVNEAESPLNLSSSIGRFISVYFVLEDIDVSPVTPRKHLRHEKEEE